MVVKEEVKAAWMSADEERDLDLQRELYEEEVDLLGEALSQWPAEECTVLYVEGNNIGWRKLPVRGIFPLDQDLGKSFLGKILPKTDCHWRATLCTTDDEQEPFFEVTVWHHDSPVGETYLVYKVRPPQPGDKVWSAGGWFALPTDASDPDLLWSSSATWRMEIPSRDEFGEDYWSTLDVVPVDPKGHTWRDVWSDPRLNTLPSPVSERRSAQSCAYKHRGPVTPAPNPLRRSQMPRYNSESEKWFLLDGESISSGGFSLEVKDGDASIDMKDYPLQYWDDDLRESFEVVYLLDTDGSYRLGLFYSEEYTEMLRQAAENGEPLDHRPGWEPSP